MYAVTSRTVMLRMSMAGALPALSTTISIRPWDWTQVRTTFSACAGFSALATCTMQCPARDGDLGCQGVESVLAKRRCDDTRSVGCKAQREGASDAMRL
jgi:hypothetical protein